MSNQAVGQVYDAVIKAVIGASQNEFEEFGVDPSTLDELQKGWQEKLSALKIATFPWDPKIEAPRQPPTVPSNVKNEPDVSPAVATSHQEHVNFPNVAIKTERGAYEQPLSAYPVANGGYNDHAAQRAREHVARLGAPNIQMPHQQQGQVAMHGQQRMMPGQGPQRPQQYMQQPQQPRPQGNPVYNSQTDGSDGALDDWKAFMAAKRAVDDAGPDGRVAADNLMRTRIDAMMANQDLGLGMPLSEMPKGNKRKAITRVRLAQQAEASSSSSAPRVAPFDGEEGDSPKENPEDAINSDLDDTEDEMENPEADDDEMQTDYILCTYDKVQRVKNKWKCTLKDGVLSTNRQDYLFHKANGEFEW